MDQDKTYRVKILDFRYEDAFSQLNFRYLHYEILAKNKRAAVKMARHQYMSGQEATFSEELPFLLKLITVDGD